MKILAVLVLALGLVTAVPAFGQTSGDLEGTQWQLVSIAGEALPDNSAISLEFGEDHRVGGSGGCNRYGAGYTVDGDSIRFGGIFSTRRACLDAASATQEQAYFEALHLAVSYTLSDDELSISYGDSESLVFHPVSG